MITKRGFRTLAPSFPSGPTTLAGLRGDDDLNPDWVIDENGQVGYGSGDTGYAVNPDWSAAEQQINQQVAQSSGMNMTQLISAITQGYGQLQLQQINIKRAQAGLPALNAAAYAPGVNVGLTPQTQQLVMYGGLALLALLAFSSFNKRRA